MLPMMSRLTEVVWAGMRALLSAVQEMEAPCSCPEMSVSRMVLVTVPLRLSTSSPTGDTGTEFFLQVMTGSGSPPRLLQ